MPGAASDLGGVLARMGCDDSVRDRHHREVLAVETPKKFRGGGVFYYCGR